MFRALTMIAILVCAIAGCRHAEPEGMKYPLGRLSASRLEPNSTILKIAVLQIVDREIDEFDEAWRLVDSQSVSLEQRKLWDRNGLRVAIAGAQLPEKLVSLTDPNSDELTQLTHKLDDATTQQLAYRMRFIEHQRLQIRPGEENWVGCSRVHPQLMWTVHSQTGRRTGVCEQAVCGFNVSVEPQGDGSVRLNLKPELHFGPRRHRFRVSEDSFLFQQEPDRLALQELDLSHVLRPGETLLVASTTKAVGLGENFFVIDNEHPSRRVLMIRVLHTQLDDLFVPPSSQRPLATSTL